MPLENVARLRSVYEDWSRGAFAVPPDLYDPYVQLITRPDIPDADQRVGPADLSDYMRGYLDPLADVTWTAEEFVEADGSVVVPTRQRARGKQSGVLTDDLIFVVWTFRGRTVIRIEFFEDRAKAFAAAGLPL